MEEIKSDPISVLVKHEPQLEKGIVGVRVPISSDCRLHVVQDYLVVLVVILFFSTLSTTCFWLTYPTGYPSGNDEEASLLHTPVMLMVVHNVHDR